MRSLSILVGVHYRFGNYATALDLYLKNLDEIAGINAKQIDTNQDKANLFNNLTGVYGALGNYEMAIAMARQTIDMRRELGDSQGLASALLNMGNAYLRQRRFEDVLRYLQRKPSLRSTRELEARTRHGILRRRQHLCRTRAIRRGD